MRLSIYYAIIFGCILSLLVSIFIWYKVFTELHETKAFLNEKFSTEKSLDAAKESNVMTASPDMTKRQFWSAIQQSLKDTVVQVFSQIAEFNWVEPYKSPSQNEAVGTAFFINDQGNLITNAHVIDQAKVVFIQIPSIGKRRFELDVIGVSPERDLALLKLKKPDLEAIKKELKTDKIPYLKLGDSDTIYRADKLMALGYPLGQQGLKSTTGVVSGREHLSGQYFIQISAPLNKGNSGGPSLNYNGEVIGVNAAIIQNAQNVGYIIPINEVKLFLEQLDTLPETKGPKLLHKPFLGVLYNNANDNLTKFLGNPEPGGLYVVDIYKGSLLQKAGVQAGDMIYKLNGYPVDIYGEMNVPWSKEDKVSLIDFVARLKLGQDVNIEFYRKGTRKTANFKFSLSVRPPIRRAYPGYENVDYEVFGGLVIMPLTVNHIILLAQFAPELIQYADLKKHMDPALLVTHILINSPSSRARCISAGAIISQVNGEDAKTLEDLRRLLKKSIDTGYVMIKTTENICMALPLEEIVQSEARMAASYYYPISKTYKEIEQELIRQNKIPRVEGN